MLLRRNMKRRVGSRTRWAQGYLKIRRSLKTAHMAEGGSVDEESSTRTSKKQTKSATATRCGIAAVTRWRPED